MHALRYTPVVRTHMEVGSRHSPVNADFANRGAQGLTSFRKQSSLHFHHEDHPCSSPWPVQFP